MLTRDAIKKQVPFLSRPRNATQSFFKTNFKKKIFQGSKYHRFKDKETKNQKGKTLNIHLNQRTTVLCYLIFFYKILFLYQPLFQKFSFRFEIRIQMSRILAGLRKSTQLFRLRQCSDYVGPFLVQTDKGAIYQPGMNTNDILYVSHIFTYLLHKIGLIIVIHEQSWKSEWIPLEKKCSSAIWFRLVLLFSDDSELMTHKLWVIDLSAARILRTDWESREW